MSVPNQDKYEKFIVVVNGGSGVIFQPITEEYSYILTAKHTLYDDKETMKKPIKKHKLEVKGSNIEFIGKYEHDTLDIAIVKIKRLNITTTPIIGKLDNNGEQKYDFFGHPNRDNHDSLDNFKVIANKTKDDKKIMIFDECDYSGQEAISGASGGGIFRELDDRIYLIAIEFEMNAKQDTKRRDRRIKAYSIKVFDEIIKKYDKEELVYLDDSKNFVEEDIFYLDDGKSITIKTVPVEVDGKILNISVYPVTFEEYDLFCIDTNKERPNKDYGEGKKPIVRIDWYEANSYCKWLSKDNKTFCLLSSKDWEDIAQKNMSNVSKDNWKEYVLCNENSEYRIDEVNKRKCGALGIYDMYGNIHEWCSDGENENMRRAKGGSFQNTLDFILDTTKCSNFFKLDKEYELGFRVVYILDFLKELIDKLEQASYNLHETLLKVLIQEDDYKKFQYKNSIKLIKITIDEIYNLSSENIKNIVYDIKNIENERKKYDASKYISRYNPIAVLQKDYYIHSNLLFNILRKVHQDNQDLLNKVNKSEYHAQSMIDFLEELLPEELTELIENNKPQLYFSFKNVK